MIAAVLTAYGQALELAQRPMPQLQRPDQVIVRVGGAGVCATDLHAIDGLMGAAGVTLPRILGHENAGWIHEVGDLVSTVAVGDPVIIYPPFSCGLCVACRRGDDMHCTRHEFTGLTVDGGFAQFIAVAERQLIRLPGDLAPDVVAPHADAGLTAYHAVRRVAAAMVPGTTAVAIGIGGVGHIAVQLMREFGSSTIVAVDSQASRRTMALELGADHAVGAGEEMVQAVGDLTGGRGADVVLDFVGSDATHRSSLEILARGGTCAVVGYGGTMSVDSSDLVVGELSLVGSLVGSWTDLHELIALHVAGRVTLRVQTHPLHAIHDVLQQLRAGTITGRAVLVP